MTYDWERGTALTTSLPISDLFHLATKHSERPEHLPMLVNMPQFDLAISGTFASLTGPR